VPFLNRNPQAADPFPIDGFPEWGRISVWDKLNDRLAPSAGHIWFWRSLPDGKGARRFQCFDCDESDPLNTDRVMGWINSELQPPK
jgi:hypothetical protein